MKSIHWTSVDIQKVNNFLLIKGNQFLKANHDPDAVYRACYDLPSDPEKMNDWIDTYLSKKEADELYKFLFS